MTDAEMRAKEAKREYYRKYRATHREQIKEHNTRYWEKKWMQMEHNKGQVGFESQKDGEMQ